MKYLQRQKGLLRRSIYIGLSIAILSLSYTSSCMAEPEMLVRASVRAESNVNAINEKQKSIDVEKYRVQKKQLLTPNEINSLEIKEKDNCRLLQLRAGDDSTNMMLIVIMIMIACVASIAAGNP
ncbi:MAG: hypothetical protein ABIK53_01285 [bacterium]